MRLSYILLGIIILALGWHLLSDTLTGAHNTNTMATSSATIIPIQHATAVITWDDQVFYTDPTGGAGAFANQPTPTIILLTDIHGDHLEPDTLREVIGTAVVIAPQAVKDELPEDLAAKVTVMKNGETIAEHGFAITAIPMYNLPESTEAYHPKGRGNGYVLEKNGERVYIAGDTQGIPEMRTLQNIDIALIPMNLPYTMTVEEAADAVLAFKPRHVYPYHYRNSDVEKFKSLVNAGNPDINVVLLDWYAQSE